MTSTTTHSPPQFAAAGVFLEQLATGDMTQLAVALEDTASLTALLPRGLKEWRGRDAVCEAFDMFFGGLDELELLDAEVGQVGNRMQLRWRLHARGGRLGDDNFVVEQFCYADGGSTGRIQSMSLVCSGFCRERAEG
jgi:hypothetical protein